VKPPLARVQSLLYFFVAMSRSESSSHQGSLVWREHLDVRYVTVTGEVDLSNTEALERALASQRLHIDMSRVTFIDTTALRVLINARMGATEFDVIASRTVLRLLEIAAVTDLLNAVEHYEPERA
jgi:anti-anti-sigma factor